MKKTNNDYRNLSDRAILKEIGFFIKNIRLEMNKTQEQLAKEAGISRFTLGNLESGKGSNLISLIQVLRMLDKLELLENFRTERKISPIVLAEMEMSQRVRASGTKKNKKNRSDW
ncbi:MAG: helix-turn-helix domain-containing protein [Candidatus Delongbacteria bacterium]|nr:helix-turn-helix domain-containing protein [Candidatus Delongbacteria bacterium]